LPPEQDAEISSMSHTDHKMSVLGMSKGRTSYKFVGEQITYYADSGGYCLVA